MKGTMNDQFEQMRLFQDALIRFNDQLGGSMRELERRHDYVSPHWQDDMRKEYDRQWSPLSDIMKRYLNRESRAYVEFLSIKLHALGRYLHG
jgi:hypothetical protein